MKSSLTLKTLTLEVNLGWPTDERTKKQTVAIDVKINFPKPPEACISDQLADTCCYDSLIATIKTQLISRNFRLIEHLAHEIYQIAKQSLPNHADISIRVTKKPAIADLTGGVSFCYGDIAW